EDRPELLGVDLPTVGVGVLLHDARELDLQAPGQVQVPGRGEQVGDTALAGLRVDADHGLVGATDVLGVDRQVRQVPDDGAFVAAGRGDLLRPVREPLLDGVLVRAGERGVDEVAAVRVPGVDVHLGALLDGAADLVDV